MALLDGAQVEMRRLHGDSVSVSFEQLISVSDAQLVQKMLQSLSVFSFTVDGFNFRQIECLTPYNPVSSEVQASESIVVGTFQPELRLAARLAVFSAALIRDTLRDNWIELLSDAYHRPQWLVMLADLHDWYISLREFNADDLYEHPPLLSKGQDGQNCITGLPRWICWRQAKPVIMIQ